MRSSRSHVGALRQAASKRSSPWVRPEKRWQVARDWLSARGFESTLEYVRAMAITVLEETGLLPHLNPGVMTWQEMARLKPVAPSMGMMMETTSHRLFASRRVPTSGHPTKTLLCDCASSRTLGACPSRSQRGCCSASVRTSANGRTPCWLPVRVEAARTPPRGHHPELPREARHGDAGSSGLDLGRAPSCDRHRPSCSRRGPPDPSAAEPVRTGESRRPSAGRG